MRILIFTSCTGQKLVNSDLALTEVDFKRGSEHVKECELQLEDLLTSAGELYTGQQHVRLMKGIRQLREKAGDIAVDLYIVSAGYGLVPEDQKLAPYECTFTGRKKSNLRAWSEHLNIPSDFRKTIAKPFDLGLLLLGDDYLSACELDETVVFGGPTLAFCGKKTADRLSKMNTLIPIVLSNQEAKRFSCGLVGLKGELSARLLQLISEKPNSVNQLTIKETDVLSLLDHKQLKAPKKSRTAKANPRVDNVIDLPDTWRSKPHRSKLRYFIPEWDDLVDPDYDFETDTHSGGTGSWSNQVYAHQMYSEPNYDGILVSKVVAEKSKKKKELINKLGVHRYLRVPRQFPIMGDCGAFGYVNEEEPPYSTEEILDYYSRLDFDYGVSLDHLIVSATEAHKKQRYDLTISNADEFLKEHQKLGLPWTPIGAVQGWDPNSYVEAAKQYVAMGYEYIALGGLVRSSTPDILRILEAVRANVPGTLKIHLFGVARLQALSDFTRYKLTSVDSASYLRQAWMRTKQSYLLEDGRTYAALRIPEAGKSFRAKHMRTHPELTDDKIMSLEQNALQTVRAYTRNQTSIDSCLDALLEYDRFVTSNREDMRSLYYRTLEEKPWEQCGCSICREAGIEVVIFRGNNRNRRRGFHNTYAFYKLFGLTIENAKADNIDASKQLELC